MYIKKTEPSLKWASAQIQVSMGLQGTWLITGTIHMKSVYCMESTALRMLLCAYVYMHTVFVQTEDLVHVHTTPAGVSNDL